MPDVMRGNVTVPDVPSVKVPPCGPMETIEAVSILGVQLDKRSARPKESKKNLFMFKIVNLLLFLF